MRIAYHNLSIVPKLTFLAWLFFQYSATTTALAAPNSIQSSASTLIEVRWQNQALLSCSLLNEALELYGGDLNDQLTQLNDSHCRSFPNIESSSARLKWGEEFIVVVLRNYYQAMSGASARQAHVMEKLYNASDLIYLYSIY